MGTLFVYIVKSALCLTILYLPYTLLLRRERLYRQNRALLLGILVVSFLLPAWHGNPLGSLSFFGHAAVGENVYAVLADEIRSAGDAPVRSVVGGGLSVARWAALSVLVYVLGAVVLMGVRMI